jgi:hypothetical protein
MIGKPGARSQLLKNRYLWLALGLVALLLGLLIISAPATNRQESGSTWNRSPAGYSAWFEALADQGIRINRWQRPIPQLIDLLDNGPDAIEGTTTTLIKTPPSQAEADMVSTLVVVLPTFLAEGELPGLVPWLPDWLNAGHRLVLLGVKTPVTAAPFSQTLASEFGRVEIHTRRRHQGSMPGAQQILADEYGTLIWSDEWQLYSDSSIADPGSNNSDPTPLMNFGSSHSLGATGAQHSSPTAAKSGELIFIGTPFLAANAYLNAPGNFALLTDLVTRDGGQVWVDEYLHGYRDGEALTATLGREGWLAYLARTPWLVVGVQALALTLLALLALNHRLGQRLALPEPTVDNSQAYITALAGVLHKANSSDFLVHTIAQAERGRLQTRLGLGHNPVSDEQLITAWGQQTGGTAADLAPLLQPQLPTQDDQIKAWLQQLQSVHQFTQTRTGP